MLTLQACLELIDGKLIPMRKPMARLLFELLVGALGLAFAIAFCVLVLPPLFESGDIAGAFAAGFVNPYASGYSLDTILCGLILFVWVAHERAVLGIRHGWVAFPLAIAPGVATAFAAYLIIRSRQIGTNRR